MSSITRNIFDQNETQVSRLEYQINAILLHEKIKSFSNECLLSCCTLLVQETNDSVFHNVLSKHIPIIDFSYWLIHCKNESDPLLSRLGVRVLCRCLNGDVTCDTRTLKHIQKLDSERFLQILVQFLKTLDQNETIEKNQLLFTIELIELCAMIIQVTSDVKQYQSLSELPSLMVAACMHVQNASCIISCTKEIMEKNHGSMEIVLEHVLGTRKASDNDIIASFISDTSEFMAVHAHTLLPISALTFMTLDIAHDEESKVQGIGIVSREFLLQLSNLLFSGIRGVDGSMKNITTDAHLMLHYALITYMCLDIRICEELLTKKETDVPSLIQKIVLAGLASDSDVIFHTYLKINISGMIRTMTLFVTAKWMEKLGFLWLIDRSVSSENSNTLGRYSVFCTIARLVAGELRIVLGTLFDCILHSKDPDKAEISVSGRNGEASKVDYNHFFQRGIDCTRIQLCVLQMMVEMACDDECNSHMEHHISSDAIIHIRHSLQDTFDSCIQFLSDVMSETLSEWRLIYLYSIRFIGAYLSEVNVFDHDDDDDVHREYARETPQQFDRQGQRHDRDSSTSTPTSVSVTSILRAIKNGLSISTADEEMTVKFSFTLFPCIVATITCCETPEQVQVLCKELLSDSIITESICKILQFETRRASKFGTKTIDRESKSRISWCCVMLDTILNFDSTFKPRSFPSCLTISVRKNILEHLFKFSKIVGNDVCENDDDAFIKDFAPLLVDVVQCWMSVSDSLHSLSSSHSTCVEDEMQMMNLHTWLNNRGYLD